MLQQIVDRARAQNKNILIIGSPRSGTHPLGTALKNISNGRLLGEICPIHRRQYWTEIQQLYNTPELTIGQLVQLSPKILLSSQVDTIKKHTVIVNIRRKDKVKQFASYVYFKLLDPTWIHGWHNHKADKTRVQPGSIEVSDEQLDQFIVEQLVDDFFLPDVHLCYEDIDFSNQKTYFRNQFTFPLEQMFSNLDYVKQRLENWHYHQEHFKNG